ncbi:MAG: sulfatase-like hydrolase/transferase [Micromonosporaceae bacterium]
MKKRPNILFLCTDQQRFDTLGCYGNQAARTPVLDGLAAQGVTFEQCYVQSPVCGPSRASLMTGKYVHDHGLYANGVSLPDGNPLFMRNLADAGYDCGLVGKQHLAACFGGRTEPRRDDGYRVYRWSHDPTHESPENAYHHWLKAHHPDLYAQASQHRRTGTAGIAGDAGQDVGFATMPTEAHYSHWAAEEAIEFLSEERESDQPFFLWVNFFDPHHPFVAPREYLDRFDPAALPDPVGGPGILDDRPPILEDASKASYAGALPGFQDHTAEEIKEIIRAYYAMVSLVDDEVGRILAALAASGLDENTLVVFTSDHGEMLGDHQLLLKGPMFYEGAVRVPLLMRWPGVLPAGERRSQLVQWVDLTSTLCAAAGAPAPPRAQGTNLLPLATGDTDQPVRDWALCEYRDSGHAYDPPVYATMLRRDEPGHRWKLVVHHGSPATGRDRTGELYDLAADPTELRNLWHDPAHQATRAELQSYLMDLMVATENRTQPRDASW